MKNYFHKQTLSFYKPPQKNPDKNINAILWGPLHRQCKNYARKQKFNHHQDDVDHNDEDNYKVNDEDDDSEQSSELAVQQTGSNADYADVILPDPHPSQPHLTKVFIQKACFASVRTPHFFGGVLA